MTDPGTMIDLFCGAGGMSAGFSEAGFSVVAAVDSDKDCILTFRQNHPDVQHAMVRSLERGQFTPQKLQQCIGRDDIDLVIGGPPCQGFSKASMNPEAKANFGPGSKNRYDRRNSYYRRFFHFVRHFKPSAFVMENVPTLLKKTNGLYVKKARSLGRSMGFEVSVLKLNAADFGIPQTRRRLFIVGTRNPGCFELPEKSHFPDRDDQSRYRSVGDAIMDLPVLKAGSGSHTMEYDEKVIRKFERDKRFLHKYARWARDGEDTLRHHISRYHSERDLGIFKMLKPGVSSAQLPAEQQELIPYSMTSFKDKYRRQPMVAPSTTVTAHIAKDGLYYIHPVQNRSFTPREAARLQSFRDSYTFSGCRTSVYRQIGNAVPPLLAKAIAEKVIACN